MKKLQAKGTLGRLLANIDEQRLYRTEQKMRIAAKIGMALRARNLSNKDFAQMMGCSAPEVSDILSGTRNLTLDKLSDIERKLGIELTSHSMTVLFVVGREMLSIKQKGKGVTEYAATNIWNGSVHESMRAADCINPINAI